jgi:NADH-quinone oxidoreductase subunit M
MIAIVPIAAALAFAASAAVVGRCRGAAAARGLAARLSAWITAASVVLAAAAWWHGGASIAPPLLLLPAQEPRLAPIVFDMIALVAVTLAPLASHPPSTVARILALIACAQLAVATDIAAVVALGWVWSAWIVWRDLRGRRDCVETARLFAVSQSASAVGFSLAAVLLHLGHATAAAALAVVAIGIRAGVLPGHSWLVSLVEKAPMGLVVAFVAPQLGVYAVLVSFGEVVPVLPTAALAVAGAATAFLSAGLALVQIEARRAVAFLAISQMALVLVGATSSSGTAHGGAIVTWEALALGIAGLAMTLAAVEARRGRLSLATPGGSFARTPRLAIHLLLFGLASVGFPLSLGFIGEDLLIQGATLVSLRLVTIVAAALNGITVMRCFLYLFSGPPAASGEPDLRPREVGALAVLLFTLLAGGLLPRLIISGAM